MEETATGPLRLSFESKQQVVVVPENEDRFLTTSRAAALACQQAEKLREWQEQFQGFLTFIHEWCGNYGDEVSACYVTVGDTGMNVLVCLRSDDYNFELDDALAELDLNLFNDFPLCTADVMQIPNQKPLTDELNSKNLRTEALIVYGDGTRSS